MSYRRALFWSAALLLNGAAALSAGDVVATITDNTGTTIRVSNLVTRYEFRAASDLKWVTTTMGGLVVTVWGHQGAARWEQRLGFELADLKRISFGHKPELRLEIVRRDGTALTITMTSLTEHDASGQVLKQAALEGYRHGNEAPGEKYLDEFVGRATGPLGTEADFSIKLAAVRSIVFE
jgi:hypothetical protein